MDPNPYQSPMIPAEPSSPTRAGEHQHGTIAAWERLRLQYNGILAGVVLLTTLLEPTQFLNPDFWIGSVLRGIGANVCFCVGAPLEYCLSLIGSDRRRARIFLFVVGTLFSMLLTFATIMLIINEFQIQD